MVLLFLHQVEEFGVGKVWMGGPHFVIHVDDKIKYVNSDKHQDGKNWKALHDKNHPFFSISILDLEYRIVDVFKLPEDQTYYEDYWKNVRYEVETPSYHWHCYDQGAGGKQKKR